MSQPILAVLDPPPEQERSAFEAQAKDILDSGLLARSRNLARLFDFLLRCHRTGRVPKEVELAVEGLGRSEGFDVTQDAIVRVYIHKLRHKLDAYYRQAGKAGQYRLSIPRGEYRLVLEPLPETFDTGGEMPAIEGDRFRFSARWLAVTFLVLLLSLALNAGLLFGIDHTPEQTLRRHAPWQALFADERPVLIVVGDYYLFAEADRSDTVRRLIRDFNVNSPTDLAGRWQQEPQDAGSQFDVGLSYLPTSIAQALARLVPILNGPSKKPWGVVLSSELIPENLRNNHIVYIGHLSALGVLEDLVFAHSGFRRGRNYDELLDAVSGQTYFSDSGVPHPAKNSMHHLAYLSSFQGLNGNRVVVIAGFRDAGLRELAENLATENGLAALEKLGTDFEGLYETVQLSLSSTPAKPLLLREIKSPTN